MINVSRGYGVFVVVGILMTIGTTLKLFFGYDFSSDWFWLLAGIGLIVEGAVSLIKQRKFDQKYKIIEKSEINNKDKRGFFKILFSS